jgi:RNA polymerase-binding transcription factor DksA
MSEQPVISVEETKQLEEALRLRLRELAARVERIEAEAREPLDDDFADQAIDREDDEAADAMERVSLDEIAAIETALNRIESGAYGRCLSCGEPISLPRLQIVPEATRCILCAGGILDS